MSVRRQAEDFGSIPGGGSPPLGREVDGTELRLPGVAVELVGSSRRTLASGSPRMMAPISSPVSVSCSSRAWAIRSRLCRLSDSTVLAS